MRVAEVKNAAPLRAASGLITESQTIQMVPLEASRWLGAPQVKTDV